MQFKVGDEFVVAFSDGSVRSTTVYAVRGIDQESGRMWFCVAGDPAYDGYDGDFVASQVGESLVVTVHLRDDRSSLPSKFMLCPVLDRGRRNAPIAWTTEDK